MHKPKVYTDHLALQSRKSFWDTSGRFLTRHCNVPQREWRQAPNGLSLDRLLDTWSVHVVHGSARRRLVFGVVLTRGGEFLLVPRLLEALVEIGRLDGICHARWCLRRWQSFK